MSTYTSHRDQMLAYLKALKIIVGADGHIAREEMDALLSVVDKMSVSEVVRREVEEWDFSTSTLEELLPFMTPGGRIARMLLRHAVFVARADGVYALEEQQAVAKAARILRIDTKTVGDIERLVEAEELVEKLNRAIFETYETY